MANDRFDHVIVEPSSFDDDVDARHREPSG
jgi:hypothetical protein